LAEQGIKIENLAFALLADLLLRKQERRKRQKGKKQDLILVSKR